MVRLTLTVNSSLEPTAPMTLVTLGLKCSVTGRGSEWCGSRAGGGFIRLGGGGSGSESTSSSASINCGALTGCLHPSPTPPLTRSGTLLPSTLRQLPSPSDRHDTSANPFILNSSAVFNSDDRCDYKHKIKCFVTIKVDSQSPTLVWQPVNEDISHFYHQ